MFKLVEGKAIYQHSLFWCALLIPVILAITFSIPLVKGLQFDLSASGYEFFLKQFSFPIWLLSSSLLFGFVIARFHLSKQKAKAIMQAEINNNFRNYFDHKTLFFEEITESELEFACVVSNQQIKIDIVVDIEKFYAFSFPQNTIKHFIPSLIDNSGVFPINRAYKSVSHGDYDFNKDQTDDFELKSFIKLGNRHVENWFFDSKSNQPFVMLIVCLKLLKVIEKLSSDDLKVTFEESEICKKIGIVKPSLKNKNEGNDNVNSIGLAIDEHSSL